MRQILNIAIAVVVAGYLIRQCRKPSGPLGKFFLSVMNKNHYTLTTWGLQHANIGDADTILDIGCGGGRTVQRLAAMASQGKVVGVDYADASVATSRRLNAVAIQSGSVEVQQASVSNLPFPDAAFDLVTAVETHYYWPDRPGAMSEILRVLKPGGRFLLIAEVYRGQSFDLPYRIAMKLLGGAYLTANEHRDLFANAGYTESRVFLEASKGWISATGTKRTFAID